MAGPQRRVREKMADVFVSYKREDRAAVTAVVEALRSEGFSVWWDDAIGPDRAFDEIIEREIAAAKAVVVAWSPRAVKAEWVRTEAHYAADAGKLVPMMIAPCELPLAFRLKQTADLGGWAGDLADPRWRKLVSWVADRCAVDAPAAPAENAAPAADKHQRLGAFLSGEPVVAGEFVGLATPAGTLFRDGPDLPAMRIVPAGFAVIGGMAADPLASDSERPPASVAFARPFAMSALLVSNAEYLAVPAPATPVPAPAASTLR